MSATITNPLGCWNCGQVKGTPHTSGCSQTRRPREAANTITFSASHGNNQVVDVDSDLEAIWDRTQGRANRDLEQHPNDATPHYVITLWADGEPDRRTLHIYGGKPDPDDRMSARSAFERAHAEHLGNTVVEVDAEVVEAADALWLVLVRLNEVEALAYQREGTPYQHTVDALTSTLRHITHGDAEWATDLYEAMMNCGERPSSVLPRLGFQIKA